MIYLPSLQFMIPSPDPLARLTVTQKARLDARQYLGLARANRNRRKSIWERIVSFFAR